MSRAQYWGDMDLVSRHAVDLGRTSSCVRVSLPDSLPWTEQERDDIDGIARDLALSLITATMQDLQAVRAPETATTLPVAHGCMHTYTTTAAERERAHTAAKLAVLRAWVECEQPFPAQDSTLGAAWAELPGAVRGRRKRWAARLAMRAVYEGTLRAMLGYLAGGGSPQRTHARMVIAERYAGLTRDSWERLATTRHVSERVLRGQMRELGLPTARV